MELVRFESEGNLLVGKISRPKSPPPYKPAIIAHPHPLYGGSMENNVVLALRDALVSSGWLALRFNFRGVAPSEGRYGNVLGEARDIISAEKFLRSLKEVNDEPVVLCGYSFGGLCALYALAEGLCAKALILISPMPPEQGFDKEAGLAKILPLNLPTLILLGAQDQFFSAELYKPLISESTQLKLVSGADHFYWGAEQEIKSLAKKFISSL